MVSRYEIFAIFHKVKILFFTSCLILLAIPGTIAQSTEIYEPVVSQHTCLAMKPWPLMLLCANSILFIILLMVRKTLEFAKQRFVLEGIINERTEELLKQKEKVDELLSNMLPRDTANQLKSTGKATTRKYGMVTILFSDIEGFTRIAEQMNPEVLVDELDKFFFEFDSLVEDSNIEKIKTIGDAYMAAGGIPEGNRTNPVDVVLAAIKIMQYMKRLKIENENFWDLRIGIHTGPVIAGVVGQKKLSYDIWGDSVNTASRMESSGEPGRINISGSTFELVRDFFACEYRGKMPVKYKGNIDMYFVKGFRPELSIDMKGEEPNNRFFVRLQNLRLSDIVEKYLKRIEEKIPADLCFHNHKYCVDLLTRCELLFGSEQISEEDRLIVKTAALFDCCSYLKGYSQREKYIQHLLRETLPKYHYTRDQALQISSLLTNPFYPPAAKTLPEMVLSDARLAFIGKPGFEDAATRLYRELKAYGKVASRIEFINDLGYFLQSFKFYTLTAQKLAEIPPRLQVEELNKIADQPIFPLAFL